jgi:hypothetical protein
MCSLECVSGVRLYLSSLFSSSLLSLTHSLSLSQRFEQFIEILQNGLRDPLVHFKRTVLQTAYELVTTKPEKEFEMLAMLLNKLGDPERQIASKSAYLLQCLTEHHPQMKTHIIKEVDQYLARPGLSEKAIYYAIIFLNQIVLRRDDYELSAQLITIYFSLFKKWTKDDESIKSEGKLLSALLTGVNRAFPFAAKVCARVCELCVGVCVSCLRVRWSSRAERCVVRQSSAFCFLSMFPSTSSCTSLTSRTLELSQVGVCVSLLRHCDSLLLLRVSFTCLRTLQCWCVFSPFRH